MFVSTTLSTPTFDLSQLIGKLDDLVNEAAQRDRQAYLGAEQQFQEEVTQAMTGYRRCLQALGKERLERGAQVRTVRSRVDAIEQERRNRLAQLDHWAESEREEARQRVKQQVMDTAAAFAQAKRQQGVLVDKVDTARALISQYDDLANLLAQVDEQILLTAENVLAAAELAYQAALAKQADCVTIEIKAIDEAYKSAKDGIMIQAQADYQLAVAAETEFINRVRDLSLSDGAVVGRLREERDAGIAAARAKFDEACLWHSDGKAAIEAERAAAFELAAEARARVKAERDLEIERRAEATAEAKRRARAEAGPCIAEINELYSARRIAEIESAASKHMSPSAAQLVKQAAHDRKCFVGEVRQLLSEFPKRPDAGIELIMPQYAGVFNVDGTLVELWTIKNGLFAVGDDKARRKFAGWKPGRIFNQAKQPGCVAFKFPAG